MLERRIRDQLIEQFAFAPSHFTCIPSQSRVFAPTLAYVTHIHTIKIYSLHDTTYCQYV